MMSKDLHKRAARHLLTDCSEKAVRRCLRAKLRDIARHAKVGGHKPCCVPMMTLLSTFTDTCQCCGKQVGIVKIRLDHCHTTGQFRGWVCYGCNMVLGYVDRDSDLPHKLTEYLFNRTVTTFSGQAAELVLAAIERYRQREHKKLGELNGPQALLAIMKEWTNAQSAR